MKLGLLMTRGVTLDEWKSSGIYDRELELYRQQLKNTELETVYIFDYNIGKIRRVCDNIILIPIPYRFAIFQKYLHLCSLVLPLLHYKHFRKIALIKTNQIDGGLAFLTLRTFFLKKILICRCGYLPSKLEYARLQNTRSWRIFLRYLYFKYLEKFLFHISDICIVASRTDQTYVCKKPYQDFVQVIPNYVDNNIFFPGDGTKKLNRMVFVGRLDPVKNLHNTVTAVAESGYGIDIIGEGSEKSSLEELVSRNSFDVNFLGILPNKKVGEKLREYKYYIQCSLHEGQPKTIIEAGASGCLRIGSNVNGIREVIIDGHSGVLADGTDVDAIKSAIKKLEKMDHDTVRANTLQASKQYSLEKVLDANYALLSSIK